MQRLGNEHGFTLLEILFVFAIMALILAIVPPFLPRVIDSAHVRAAAWELSTALKKARKQAISRQQTVPVRLNVAERYYRVAQQQKDLKLPEEVVLSLTTAQSEQLDKQRGQIRFFPDGSSTGGQIKLSYNEREYRIDVHWLTGKVQLSL